MYSNLYSITLTLGAESEWGRGWSHVFKQGHLRTHSHGHSCLPQSTPFLLALILFVPNSDSKQVNNNNIVFIHFTRYYLLAWKTQLCFPLHATQSCLPLTKKTLSYSSTKTMSDNLHGSEISPSTSSTSLGELPEIAAIRLGIDLVSAARRNIAFLRSVADSVWLHHTSIMVEAIRR